MRDCIKDDEVALGEILKKQGLTFVLLTLARQVFETAENEREPYIHEEYARRLDAMGIELNAVLWCKV